MTPAGVEYVFFVAEAEFLQNANGGVIFRQGEAYDVRQLQPIECHRH